MTQDTTKNTTKDINKTNLYNVLFGISSLFLLIFFVYFFGIIPAIFFGMFFGLLGIILALYSILIKLITRDKTSKRLIIKRHIQGIVIFIFLVVVFIWGFAVYQNNIEPATLRNITISNGEKTIIFQEMSHIASQNFYDKVKSSLYDAKKKGFVLFFEGVRPGTKENMDSFNDILGIKINANLYKNISKLYGLEFQDNKYFTGLVNNKDFNIDLSIDDIMTLYRQKHTQKQQNNKIQLDVGFATENIMKTLDKKELTLFTYVNKAMLNLLIKQKPTSNDLGNIFPNKDILDSILNKRNTNLVNNILKSEYKNIFITYGALHFEGVLDELNKKDSKEWDIKRIEYIYVTK